MPVSLPQPYAGQGARGNALHAAMAFTAYVNVGIGYTSGMFDADIFGIPLSFETRASLFSPGGPDKGTLAMLSHVELAPTDKVLDLGCGYGLVGCWAATIVGPQRVWMVDNDPEAIACATESVALNDVGGVNVALSDGFTAFHETGFSQILCHPPYHADFSVAKGFIEKGFNRLVVGGSLWMVTRREDWYRNRLTAIFGGVQVWREDGYFVFRAKKRFASYANRKP
jgi:16S rRNA (guanine1207-N2)-methyltransferase